MIPHLRGRLTAVCMLLTGLVVLAMCLGGFLLTARQIETNGTLLFNANLNTLTDQLQTHNSIDNAWLSQFETQNNLVAFLWDRGVPLSFTGGWMPSAQRAALCTAALRKAQEAEYRVDMRAAGAGRVGVSVRHAGVLYQGTAMQYATGETGWVSIVLLRSLRAQQDTIVRTAVLYALLGAAGMVVLGGVSWLSAGYAEKPVRRAAQEQAAFVAAASHELRSPLAVISTSAELLAEGKRDPVYLANIQSEAKRLGRLVGDLLVLAGSDAKTWTLRKTSVAPDTLLIDAYGRFAPIAAEKNIVLQVDLPDVALLSVEGDAQRLAQLLSILLDNALSYTPAGGTVILGARTTKGYLTLWVEDSGSGVPDTQKEKIFQRFYRADQSRSVKGHFGLGLAVARELCALHTGRLTVVDGAHGGAKFIAVLPR